MLGGSWKGCFSCVSLFLCFVFFYRLVFKTPSQDINPQHMWAGCLVSQKTRHGGWSWWCVWLMAVTFLYLSASLSSARRGKKVLTSRQPWKLNKHACKWEVIWKRDCGCWQEDQHNLGLFFSPLPLSIFFLFFPLSFFFLRQEFIFRPHCYGKMGKWPFNLVRRHRVIGKWKDIVIWDLSHLCLSSCREVSAPHCLW